MKRLVGQPRPISPLFEAPVNPDINCTRNSKLFQEGVPIASPPPVVSASVLPYEN